MAEETTERIYVIPLKRKGYKASIAAPTAVKRVKQYLQKHMKANEKDIWIDGSLNNELWSKGKYKMPNKIRVKAVKFEDGVVEAYLPELEFEKSRREILQEEKAKKQPILRKEEEMEEEMEEDISGTEDYDVVPTADGDVKIKKKKQPKDKEETDTEEEETEEQKTPAKPKEPKKETTKKTTESKDKEQKKPEKTTKKSTETPKETKEKHKAASSDKKETKKEDKSAEKPVKEKKSEEKSEK